MEIFGFGAGTAHVADDGAVVQVIDPDGRQLLQDHEAWGKGVVLTGQDSQRFDDPVLVRWRQSGIDLLHQLGALEVRIGRRFGEQWTETYEIRNTSTEAVEIASLAVSTPYRDAANPGLAVQMLEGTPFRPDENALVSTDESITLAPGSSYRWTWQLSWTEIPPAVHEG
ncbi:hypothetical protein AB0H36_33700 [Kribbella sp. NPDC050820]|uniref:hypothetical protein n=1 Tax=Kribbella sp. NPDC050820 TaxID=3155408 RepID=UPI0034087C1B